VIWSMICANALYVIVAFVLFGRKLSELKVCNTPVPEPISAD